MKVLIPLLSLIAPAAAFAQGQPPVQERLRVIFRDVRVHVTDRDGKPVRGLKLEDFTLKENGRPQTVTFFEEVDFGPARHFEDSFDDPEEEMDVSEKPERAPSRESNIVIVLDSSNMRYEAFSGFKEVIKELIEDRMPMDPLVKIVQIEDRLIHISPFLRNKNMLLSAVDRAEYQGAQIVKLKAQESQVVHAFSRYLDPGYDPEEAEFFRRDKQYELREAVRQKQSIKRDHFLLFEDSMRHVARVLDQMTGEKTVYLFTGGGYVESKSLVTPTKHNSQNLGRALNSANLTVYSFLHVPRQSLFEDMGRIEEARLVDQLNPIRELGPGFMPATETILENVNDLIKGPFEASDNTGGVTKALHRVSNIHEAFAEFENSVRHYYRLGYTIEAPEKDTEVSIDLTGEKKGWQLHYGKRFAAVKPYIEMAENEKAVAFEASLVYSQSFRTDLDCAWGFTGFKGLNRGETIPVYMELTTNRFSRKGYDVGFAALNDVRDLIDYSYATVRHSGKGNKFLFYDVLLPQAKPAFLRYQIIDLETGDKSLFEMPYRREKVDDERFHISGLALAEERNTVVLPVNHIRKEEKEPEVGLSLTGMRKAYDPFAIAGRLFIPPLSPAFKPGNQLHLYFQLRKADKAMEEYGIQYALKKNGEIVPCTLNMSEVDQPQKGTFNCRGILATESLAPGDYLFQISIKPDGTGPRANAVFRFEIKDPANPGG